MNNDYMFEDEDITQDGYPGVEYSFSEDMGKPKKRESTGMAVVSCVLGILSLIFFLVGINILSAIASIILGAIYISSFKQKKGRGFAWAGISTSILSIVLCIASWAFIFSNIGHIASLGNDVQGMQEWYEYYDIGDDDIYGDLFDQYPMLEDPGNKFPFDNDNFDIDDTL